MPMSSREMIKLYLRDGWVKVKGGKGSHTKMKKPGRRPQIIPNQKELKKGLERALLNELERPQ